MGSLKNTYFNDGESNFLRSLLKHLLLCNTEMNFSLMTGLADMPSEGCEEPC